MSRHQGRASDGDIVWYDGYGSLNQWQAKALQYYVLGKHVYDLGAGQLYYANKLMELGAARVTAVDSIYEDPTENIWNDHRAWYKCAPPGVELDPRPFHAFHAEGPQAIDVAFVSWPHNTYAGTLGLELICWKAKTVIYLGNNFDGTMCGSQLFWQYLRTRPLLAHAPARANSLLVFGDHHDLTEFRRFNEDDMAPEEIAAHTISLGQHWTSMPEYFL